MIVSILLTYPMLALLSYVPAQMPDAQAGSIPAETITHQVAPPKSRKEEALPDSSVALIELKQAFTEAPLPFAQRLSLLLGAEVRLPPELSSRLTLPTGKWTAETLLERVAEQVMAETHIQGTWQQVFRFTPITPGSLPPVCKLKSVGTVTLDVQGISLDALTRAITKVSGARVEMPQNVAGRFSLHCKGLAVERVLADLAAQAKLSLSCVLDFGIHEGDTGMDERIQEQLNLQEEGSREALEDLERLDAVREATGLDLLDPNANWNSVDPQIWEGLGFDSDGAGEFEQWIAQQIENQRQVALISWAMLSGALGELGNNATLPDPSP